MSHTRSLKFSALIIKVLEPAPNKIKEKGKNHKLSHFVKVESSSKRFKSEGRVEVLGGLWLSHIVRYTDQALRVVSKHYME